MSNNNVGMKFSCNYTKYNPKLAAFSICPVYNICVYISTHYPLTISTHHEGILHHQCNIKNQEYMPFSLLVKA